MIVPTRFNLNTNSLSVSLPSLIDKCSSISQLQQIHSQIITSPYPTQHKTFLLSRLLFFFTTTSNSHSSLTYATSIFHQIRNPNVFIYNIMFRICACEKEHSLQSLTLYKTLLETGLRPDNLTFPFLLKACAQRLHLKTGQSLHSHVLKLGFDKDIFIQNASVNMYGVCGNLSYARFLFDEMPERDIVSWNSFLVAYLRCGSLDSALDLFREMKERNIITWNSIITGFVQGGRTKEALNLFRKMQLLEDDRIKPDKITVASVISACASLGALDYGEWVHDYLTRYGIEFDMVIGTALVDMYGKCGCLEKAVQVFNEMPKKDVLVWTAMIAAYAIHGRGKEALHLWEEMEIQGRKPNQVTFVGLLAACAHAGLVEEGRKCFESMRRIYSVEPQVHHYACMVDLLSRAGLFEEAEELIASMPMEPDVFVWGALLGGCRIHGNVDLGERIAKYLIEVEPQKHVFYIILCNLYAKAERFDDVKVVRALMRERGIKKTMPGFSMIEIDGLVREFSVLGSSEIVMKEIEWVLNGVSNELMLAGYVANVDEVLLETDKVLMK